MATFQPMSQYSAMSLSTSCKFSYRVCQGVSLPRGGSAAGSSSSRGIFRYAEAGFTMCFSA